MFDVGTVISKGVIMLGNSAQKREVSPEIVKISGISLAKFVQNFTSLKFIDISFSSKY